jgi:hypothetical protein
MSARGKKDPISIPALVAWITLCALLSVGFLAYGASGARSTRGGVGWQTLLNLPLAAVLAGVMHVFFRLRLPRWFGWLGFAVLFLSLTGASAWSVSRQQRELRIRQAEQEATAASAAAAAAASAAAANVAIDNQKLAELVRGLQNRLTTQRRDYEHELEMLGWSRVLDGQRLRQDTSFEKTQALVGQARALVAAHRDRTPQFFAGLRRDLETSTLSDPAKRRVLAEFDKLAEREQAQALEGWALEEKVVGELGAAAQYLHENRKAWQVERGRLSLRRPADLDRLNAHLDQVRLMSDQQERMRSAAAKRLQQGLLRQGS